MRAEIEERATTVSARDAAGRLGVAVRTLRNWRWRGQGPPYTKVGRKVRYRLLDIAAWLDEQIEESR